ncbi:hypothetical protein GGR56DRAFT_161004 [Xylariaceae sp. FL0804]|nr:hypothetical protein GGR56DRAFT_161004 [Xylariaceae sp. FL0804]
MTQHLRHSGLCHGPASPAPCVFPGRLPPQLSLNHHRPSALAYYSLHLRRPAVYSSSARSARRVLCAPSSRRTTMSHPDRDLRLTAPEWHKPIQTTTQDDDFADSDLSQAGDAYPSSRDRSPSSLEGRSPSLLQGRSPSSLQDRSPAPLPGQYPEYPLLPALPAQYPLSQRGYSPSPQRGLPGQPSNLSVGSDNGTERSLATAPSATGSSRRASPPRRSSPRLRILIIAAIILVPIITGLFSSLPRQPALSLCLLIPALGRQPRCQTARPASFEEAHGLTARLDTHANYLAQMNIALPAPDRDEGTRALWRLLPPDTAVERLGHQVGRLARRADADAAAVRAGLAGLDEARAVVYGYADALAEYPFVVNPCAILWPADDWPDDSDTDSPLGGSGDERSLGWDATSATTASDTATATATGTRLFLMNGRSLFSYSPYHGTHVHAGGWGMNIPFRLPGFLLRPPSEPLCLPCISPHGWVSWNPAAWFRVRMARTALLHIIVPEARRRADQMRRMLLEHPLSDFPNEAAAWEITTGGSPSDDGDSDEDDDDDGDKLGLASLAPSYLGPALSSAAQWSRTYNRTRQALFEVCSAADTAATDGSLWAQHAARNDAHLGGGKGTGAAAPPFSSSVTDWTTAAWPDYLPITEHGRATAFYRRARLDLAPSGTGGGGRLHYGPMRREGHDAWAMVKEALAGLELACGEVPALTHKAAVVGPRRLRVQVAMASRAWDRVADMAEDVADQYGVRCLRAGGGWGCGVADRA